MVENFKPDILQRWVRVVWGGGVYVLVQAKAFYDHAALGTRTANVELTAAGIAAGGKIIGQQVWHVEENTVTPPRHPAYTLMRAVLRFARQTKDQASGYFVNLTGSLPYTDPVQGPPLVQPFCGTSTSTTIYGPLLAVPNIFAPGTFQFFRDITATYVTPAGTETFSYQVGPLADLTEADVGTGAHTVTGSSNSIWYKDEFGNFINTNRPCSELEPVGSPPSPATRIEGWNFIQGWVYLKKGITILPVASWLPEMTEEQIIIADGGSIPSWKAKVPRTVAGINSDFLPIFDDLPSDRYDWTVHKLSFEELPRKKPTELFTVPAVYSLSPPRAKYHVEVATLEPTKFWRPPREVFLAGSTALDEKFFPAGQPPLVGQTFVEIP